MDRRGGGAGALCDSVRALAHLLCGRNAKSTGGGGGRNVFDDCFRFAGHLRRGAAFMPNGLKWRSSGDSRRFGGASVRRF